nr:excinuclease ABC subunit UvrA [Crateriforma spongiae]
MAGSVIGVRGCRVHNLKNIDVDIPHGALVAVCGLSGSGKTSLALDTLYAEGQRCYIESFSAYARQYLERLDKPDCDQITGIPPALAVTRKGTTKTNRSTVATATDIADHLRLLFAKAADLICPSCGKPVVADDPETVAAQMRSLGESTRSVIGFPVHLPNRKDASEILLGLQQEGYVRLIIGGQTFRLSDEDRRPMAAKVGRGGTEAIVVVDRVSGRDDLSRLTESLETAMTEGYGKAVVLAQTPDDFGAEPWSASVMEVDGRSFQRRVISRSRRCESCDIDFPDPVPRLFNFNHPLGACPTCEGFGDVVDVDMDLVVPDRDKSIAEGAIAPWNTPSYRHELDELLALADDYDIPVDVPFKKLKKKHLKWIIGGVPERDFGGLDGFFAWLDRKKYKMHIRIFASRYRSYRTCPDCHGKRLRDEVLAYRIGDRSIADVMAMSASHVGDFLNAMQWQGSKQDIASEPVHQITRRLQFLDSVGLGYLQLDRTLRTLSGGETQRVALTGALGSDLINMLYVLDEPTAGLHPADVDRLVESIVRLQNRGNTVVVVEHDETLIRLADRVIEIGPDAGVGGGEVVFDGTPKQLLRSRQSITAGYLRRESGRTLTHRTPRKPTGWIQIRGADGHNLQSIDVDIPRGVMCLVTGVSGSGKSSLVHDTLYPAVCADLGTRAVDRSGDVLPLGSIGGLVGLNDCLLVDQSPISRSARSCPVTFVKAFDPIRKVFAETVQAKTMNLTPGHFSFNSSKGQCPRCEGAGVLEVDMQFLADVSMQCPECRGTRFRPEILQAHYRDRSIADVLAMTVNQAYHFFRGHAKVQSRLKRMIDVGLDYVTLGQGATTLSSGEGQRLKLAAFLASQTKRKTLFIMDEPTTGLHFADIVRLVDCFDALIADGHSMIVVEHHPLMMRAADYLIDLGPGAAENGGQVVATGTPEQIITDGQGATADCLRRWAED